MQLSVRLNEQLSSRIQPYLDRGLTKSALVTSALDYYLLALENQSVLSPHTSINSQTPEDQIETPLSSSDSKISRAERRRLQRNKKKGRL